MSSMTTYPDELLETFRSLFLNRLDAAAFWLSKTQRYQRITQPLTIEVMRHHLDGGIWLVPYATAPGTSLSRWFCIDWDAHGPDDPTMAEIWDAVIAARGLLLDGYEIVTVIEKTGRGYHLWGFLTTPIEAALLRAFLLAVLPGAPEINPKQARVKEGGYGNGVRIPGKYHRDPTIWSQIYDVSSGTWVDVREGGYEMIAETPLNEPRLFVLPEEDAEDWFGVGAVRKTALVSDTPPYETMTGADDGVAATDSPIDLFNREYPINEVLIEYGYEQTGDNEFCRPGAESGVRSVVTNMDGHPNRSFHHSENDPINLEMDPGYHRTCFDILLTLGCGGDQGKALDFVRASQRRSEGTSQKSPCHASENGKVERGNERAVLGAATPQEAPVFVVKRLKEMELSNPEWFVPGVIPFGCVTLIGGRPGSGKSTMVARLLADAIRGNVVPFGPGKGEPFPKGCPSVLWFHADEPGENVARRMLVTGLTYEQVNESVVFVDNNDPNNPKLQLRTAQDGGAHELLTLVRQVKASVVVVDTLLDLDPDELLSSPSAGKSAASELANLASGLGVTVIALSHVKKGAGHERIDAAYGAGSVMGAWRAAYLLRQEPGGEDHDAEGLVIGCFTAKNSHSTHRAPFGFELVGGEAFVGEELIEGGKVYSGMAEWVEEIGFSEADCAAAVRRETSGEGAPKYKLCAEAMVEFVEAQSAGVTSRTELRDHIVGTDGEDGLFSSGTFAAGMREVKQSGVLDVSKAARNQAEGTRVFVCLPKPEARIVMQVLCDQWRESGE